MSPELSPILLLILPFWLAALLRRSLAARQAVQHTSLSAAWQWGLAAQFAWLASSAVNLLFPEKIRFLDQVWFWTAILTLCPLISVLGARRPTDRVWTLFILVPLVLVLGWPALTVLPRLPDLPPIRVQAPVFLGFGLVLVMGVGNWLGTRFSLPALLTGAAVILLLLPASRLAETQPGYVLPSRVAALLLFCLAMELALQLGRLPLFETDPHDRLWAAFRTTFGIVWATRIQERINATASQERWSCRLDPHGFSWFPETMPADRAETMKKMDHTLRWLLRRFVDPPWIDHFLASPDDPPRPS